MGVQLDPAPLVFSSDPDYRALYEAVVDRALELTKRMHSAE